VPLGFYSGASGPECDSGEKKSVRWPPFVLKNYTSSAAKPLLSLSVKVMQAMRVMPPVVPSKNITESQHTRPWHPEAFPETLHWCPDGTVMEIWYNET